MVSNSKRVLIGPIDIPGTTSVDASGLINPGIGGSEMHSIALASILAKDFDVTLWVRKGPIPLGEFRVAGDLMDFSDFDIQISFTSNTQHGSLDCVPLIAVSHLPFDEQIESLPPRTVAVANIGRYQLLSNAHKAKVRGIKQIWLPAMLREPHRDHSLKAQSTRIVAGHISSMHPAKGFLHVLKGWTKYLVNAEPESQLRVVGGISLYGSMESHPTLPTELHFGNRLSKEIRESDAQSIVFLGRLSGDIANEISKWDIAVLNPKGWTESESVSMKDCWRMGVPVIAGNRFGQRDYMSDFPELQASSPRQISRILKRYQRGKLPRTDLTARAIENYSRLEQRGRLSAEKWADLVTLVTEKHGADLTNCGIPIGNVTMRQRLAVWADRSRTIIHLSLVKAHLSLMKGSTLMRGVNKTSGSTVGVE
jgi:hypothetical protein